MFNIYVRVYIIIIIKEIIIKVSWSRVKEVNIVDITIETM